MDPRDVQQQQPHAVQQQAPPQQQSNMTMMSHNSFHSVNPNSPMINPNFAPMISPNARFPFNTMLPQPPPQQHPLDVGGGGGGNGGGGGGGPGGFDGSLRFNIEPVNKKKRGRPRKYTPDGSIALGLSPTPMTAGNVARGAESSGGSGVGGNGSSEPPVKRNRGRPPGSGKKQLDALGVGGVGFTPHIIRVQAGEDVAAKIMEFSKEGPRTVCILSANGAICDVTLRQPAASGVVTYEGQYEIITLSGLLFLSDDQGSSNRSGSLSVSLAGSDGQVWGGGVAGMLKAASPVQIIVGSFIADGKKNLKSGPSNSHMLNFGAPVTTASPPSPGASSESSDDNGSLPLNRAPPVLFHNNHDDNGSNQGPPPGLSFHNHDDNVSNRCPPGMFHNHIPPPTMQNMQMYQLWSGQTPGQTPQ